MVAARCVSPKGPEDVVKWSVLRYVLVFAALLGTLAILWIDIATGLWQEYVILAGLAAGLVTFVLTTLVIDRVIARSAHQRWQPVTRLALTDLLHAIADEERSEIAHGRVVPAAFVPLGDGDAEGLRRLRHVVLAERTRLSRAVASWSSFLAASAEVQGVLDDAAELAEVLDGIRDLSLELEAGGPATLDGINGEIGRYNSSVASLCTQLQRAIGAVARR